MLTAAAASEPPGNAKTRERSCKIVAIAFAYIAPLDNDPWPAKGAYAARGLGRSTDAGAIAAFTQPAVENSFLLRFRGLHTSDPPSAR